MTQSQWFVNWGKLNPPGQSGFSLLRTASTFATLPLTSEIWVPQESVSSTHTPRHLKVDSFCLVIITIICSSVRTREILCRVSVKRHLVLRTLRLKRFESSHCCCGIPLVMYKNLQGTLFTLHERMWGCTLTWPLNEKVYSVVRRI